MSKIEPIALQKTASRSIVKEIETFGVTEAQKIDIMYFLALTLQNNENMQSICNFLKKFKKDINNVEEENIINKNKANILIME
jgi:hypothetical protein